MPRVQALFADRGLESHRSGGRLIVRRAADPAWCLQAFEEADLLVLVVTLPQALASADAAVAAEREASAANAALRLGAWVVDRDRKAVYFRVALPVSALADDGRLVWLASYALNVTSKQGDRLLAASRI